MKDIFHSSYDQPLANNPLREQIMLYAENYHRFVVQVVPMLESEFSQQRLTEIYHLARYYHRCFYELMQGGDGLAENYYKVSRQLVSTVQHILGIPDDHELDNTDAEA